MLEFPFDPDSLFSDPEIVRTRRALRERWHAERFQDETTLPGALAESARLEPDFPIVLHSLEHPGSLTLGSLHRDSLAMAGAFAARGVRHGDVVAVQLPNWTETAVAYLALATLGAVFVPIVHIYGPRETDWILDASGARMYLCPDRWGNLDFLDRLGKMRTAEKLDVVIVGDQVPAGATAWEELVADAQEGFEPPPLDSRDPLLVVYTSGTTSDPKGVVHTHETFLAELRNMPQMPMDDRDLVMLHPWPAGHIGGLCSMLGPIVTRSKVVMIDRWDPEDAADRIAEHGVTAIAGTPFHVMALLDLAEAGDPRLANINEVVSGGAGVPPALVERASVVGWSMWRSYGSSEHPTVSAGSRFGPLRPRAWTDGAICRGTEVRIVDDDGRDVEAGAEGEIWVIGPEQFVGYSDPARNAEAFAPGGWFRTGDVGVLDADGNLTITDRLKDIIIRGGENLSSLEIEDLLQRHPAVAEAAAVGFPDPRYGERVCAFVVPTPGEQVPTVAQLGSHFAQLGVARQKTPEKVVEVDDFPRTAAGKVKKNELRKLLVDEPD
ncbi:MAG: AMP-binding protein [Myxococcota bacterium]|nr:AMP-binding protein [Myxococcota bacterium]